MRLFIAIGSALVVNCILIGIYCRIERKIDLRKFAREKKVQPQNTEKLIKESIVKRFYHWINSYMYGWVRYNILLTGHVPSYKVRFLLYKYVFFMKITRKTVIFGGCEFRSPWNIVIGTSTISANCILDGRGGITIENNVVLGSGVHIWTEEHNVNDSYFRVLNENLQPVVIKEHAWVCSDTTLLPGVVVGKGAVLATRACATKNLEEFSIYGGIPAKKIGDRNKNLKYELSGTVSWHFM